MKVLIKLLVLIMLTNTVLAGQETRNGGEIENRVLRDLYDKSNCSWVSPEILIKDYEDILNLIFENMIDQSIKSENDKTFSVAKFTYLLKSNLRGVQWCLSKNPLKRVFTEDEGNVITWYKKERKQLAVRVLNRVFIDETLYNQLDNENKAFFIIHELLHDHTTPIEGFGHNGQVRSMNETLFRFYKGQISFKSLQSNFKGNGIRLRYSSNFFGSDLLTSEDKKEVQQKIVEFNAFNKYLKSFNLRYDLNPLEELKTITPNNSTHYQEKSSLVDALKAHVEDAKIYEWNSEFSKSKILTDDERIKPSLNSILLLHVLGEVEAKKAMQTLGLSPLSNYNTYVYPNPRNNGDFSKIEGFTPEEVHILLRVFNVNANTLAHKLESNFKRVNPSVRVPRIGTRSLILRELGPDETLKQNILDISELYVAGILNKLQGYDNANYHGCYINGKSIYNFRSCVTSSLYDDYETELVFDELQTVFSPDVILVKNPDKVEEIIEFGNYQELIENYSFYGNYGYGYHGTATPYPLYFKDFITSEIYENKVYQSIIDTLIKKKISLRFIFNTYKGSPIYNDQLDYLRGYLNSKYKLSKIYEDFGMPLEYFIPYTNKELRKGGIKRKVRKLIRLKEEDIKNQKRWL